MASAWGTAWGSSWANSWGPIAEAVEQPAPSTGGAWPLRQRVLRAPEPPVEIFVRLSLHAEGSAIGRLGLEARRDMALQLAAAGGSIGAINELAASATRLDRARREDDELLDML